MNILNQKKVAAIFSFAMLLTLPFVVYGASLVPCEGVKISGSTSTEDCDFGDLITLLNNIIKFLLYNISFPLVALGFMYVGARLILYQDKEGEWKKAKQGFEDIAMGFGIILGIFVLVKFALSQFLATGFTTYLFE